ncbi:MAG: SRPBCC domain-containing protein [Phenylobacterium sp.]|uniref:SRPBCC domain-containing protein n=1 Tax=Phenylobacterium sp. TaxID=1871053 RepID=UPI0027356DCC|nr:SRPBCC domain-containing protein [Phenylobacterium sp.]MDP3175612.1 SRPBCC domain-containing protein [Phenylobacterium sp.]
MSDEPEAARTLVVTRVFDAPARLVFLAHSKPEHVIRWFGPVGWPLTMCEMDFRVGGRFRFAMTGESGVQNPPFGGEYLEIVPDRRIVYDNAFEAPGSPRMVTALDFDETDGKTTLTMTTVFESQAMHDEYVGVGMEDGINSGLDQLADVVAALKGA